MTKHSFWDTDLLDVEQMSARDAAALERFAAEQRGLRIARESSPAAQSTPAKTQHIARENQAAEGCDTCDLLTYAALGLVVGLAL